MNNISNIISDLIGADRCVVCGVSKPKEEMDSPRFCKMCAKIRADEERPRKVSGRTWKLVRQFKETIPVCDRVPKPPEPVVTSPVTFPKPHWTGKNRCG